MADKFESDLSNTDLTGATAVSAPRRVKDLNDGSFATGMVDLNGQAGVNVQTDTSQATGPFVAVTILATANFSQWTETDAAGDAMTGFDIPAGVTLFGKITSFTLATGKVRAYK